MEDPEEQNPYTVFIERLNILETNLNQLVNKFLLYRNDNSSLKQRISVLEQDNESLREKRNYTVARLKELLSKFDKLNS